MLINTAVATMGEGNTPLIRSANLGKHLGLNNLYFKLEHLNPSGSYKDRFTAREISLMLNAGQKICLATSSGNTGSSLAAYASRYKIPCHIFVNENTPDEKLLQMLAYGAYVYRVKRFGITAKETEEIFDNLKNLAVKRKLRLVISAFKYSPEGMEAVKSISFEIIRQLEKAPDHVFVPVGGGGLLTAVWKGFRESFDKKRIGYVPQIHAVQPEGCATVTKALLTHSDKIESVDSTTAISGLAVPFDIDGSLALAAVRETGGWGYSVSDQEIYDSQKLLCREEGIYAEPAGAASLAGLIRAIGEGRVERKDVVVCLITGHGFKDINSIEKMTRDISIPLIEVNDISRQVEV